MLASKLLSRWSDEMRKQEKRREEKRKAETTLVDIIKLDTFLSRFQI